MARRAERRIRTTHEHRDPQRIWEGARLVAREKSDRFGEEGDDQVDELFFACQIELERLSKIAPVIVSATPRPPLERLGFALQRITQALEIE